MSVIKPYFSPKTYRGAVQVFQSPRRYISAPVGVLKMTAPQEFMETSDTHRGSQNLLMMLVIILVESSVCVEH